MKEVEAEGGSDESKTFNKNGKSKGNPRGRSDVQKSAEAEPGRLGEQSVGSSDWPKVLSLCLLF